MHSNFWVWNSAQEFVALANVFQRLAEAVILKLKKLQFVILKIVSNRWEESNTIELHYRQNPGWMKSLYHTGLNGSTNIFDNCVVS